MKIRAAIFDVYGTLFEVGPPPADAERRWQELFSKYLESPPKLSRLEFATQCDRIIARQHDQSRVRGIPWPEINWPIVVAEVLSALARLEAVSRDDFIFSQMQLGRTIRLAAGAGTVLRLMRQQNVVLGIASNAQSYTLRELDAALQAAELDLSIFEPQLRLWSFELGFSKPDPHFYQIIAARLEQRGIAPAKTLMLGDRVDNDIAPARAFGWQTWHLHSRPDSKPGGTWLELENWLRGRLGAA